MTLQTFLDPSTDRSRVSLRSSTPARAASPVVPIAEHLVGEGHPVFVIAEVGINHNGSLELAKQLVEGAARAGCHAVKFQKRCPEVCVPREQWEERRQTPWGELSYIEYKRRLEFGPREYGEIARFCRRLGVAWFASCWDVESVRFMEQFDPPCYKAASASLTDLELLRAMKATGRPLMISTGMSTVPEMRAAVQCLGHDDLLIAHSTSAYPCRAEELNLRYIPALHAEYPECPIGYSGHEMGFATTCAAVALGASFVERHVTLDRAMWGTDHAASVEISELAALVAQLREVQRACGDGVKRVYDSELPALRKLRRVVTPRYTRP